MKNYFINRGVITKVFKVRQSQWLGIIPDSDRINVSENLGKAAALPALPLITPMICIVKLLV